MPSPLVAQCRKGASRPALAQQGEHEPGNGREHDGGGHLADEGAPCHRLIAVAGGADPVDGGKHVPRAEEHGADRRRPGRPVLHLEQPPQHPTEGHLLEDDDSERHHEQGATGSECRPHPVPDVEEQATARRNCQPHGIRTCDEPHGTSAPDQSGTSVSLPSPSCSHDRPAERASRSRSSAMSGPAPAASATARSAPTR